ncbi:DMT family transporter [Deinococcus cellulosilyticus]|uniref:QacE family quaternary ammonium compound efflux SMR transporter n=1 Tax=Deinococcus cellulosilyticus (strain DSM 18568 / NBRC 106333 / KACC 11606 / 5516J-15) TaxID=1223518 RepID=A0A511N8M7_DEIC1|nr:multidrug efflux SMR transporter [Deinococcus cellulosilyticus]GEM49152.1 QacE family quaternary ammonium compound efflux SMR transporter [Deinococcus cellulosilyticus NBRC 106333 = KACC 11606]
MAWMQLMLAGVLETLATTFLKLSDGQKHLIPTVLFYLFMLCSVLLMAHTLQKLPMGTAYAVWTGVGAVGTTLVGTLWFGERCRGRRVFFLLLAATALVGLRLLP